MTAVTTDRPRVSLPRPPLTADEYFELPDDDDVRFELLNGDLVMAAAPTAAHQFVCSRLFRLLEDRAPDGLAVIQSPIDLRLDDASVVQPDILVIEVSKVGPGPLNGCPQLVVEVLSPSNGIHDRNDKRSKYAERGIPSYWIVDPYEPSVTILDLDDDGQYSEVSVTSGDKEAEVDLPYPVRFSPAQLQVHGATHPGIYQRP